MTDTDANGIAPVRRHVEPGARVPVAVVAITLACIMLLLLNATLLVVNTAGTMDSNRQYARSYEIKRSLTAFQSTIANLESGQRGFLLTGQTAYLEPYERATRTWRAEIDRLRALVADSGEFDRPERTSHSLNPSSPKADRISASML